ncbi:hypothetical protein [Streptomyces pseudovenezuelae]|uniref:hypothetical protein n=1 Tax=Streptomyces pseudovenezuelae TaxID=67350 RepID=UPI0036E4EEC0
MCIRVTFAPRQEIGALWDRERNVLVLPDELSQTSLFTIRAVRDVLVQLGVEQGVFGARCWCGEQVNLLPFIPQQRRSEQVIHSGA